MSSSSQRSKSKLKDHSTSNISQSKQAVEHFHKKKTANGDNSMANRMLKKSYSDKNMIKSRPPKMPSKNHHGGPHNHILNENDVEESHHQSK